jgi:integrative and conjugative element protein (TIGR02256 family)
MGRRLAIEARLRHVWNLVSTPNQFRIVVSARAADVIRRETALACDGLETGGILLGVQSGCTVIVKHAGAPGPKALRSSTSFLRDREYAAGFAHACWIADRSVWIGEWHTHPSMPPVPSKQDLDTYGSFLADDALEFDTFISLIVRPASRGTVMAGWWCDTSGAQSAAICIGDGESYE